MYDPQVTHVIQTNEHKKVRCCKREVGSDLAHWTHFSSWRTAEINWRKACSGTEEIQKRKEVARMINNHRVKWGEGKVRQQAELARGSALLCVILFSLFFNQWQRVLSNRLCVITFSFWETLIEVCRKAWRPAVWMGGHHATVVAKIRAAGSQAL